MKLVTKQLTFSPLLGYQTEMIEPLIEGRTEINGRLLAKSAFSWWCGDKATCICRANDYVFEYIDDASYEEYLKYFMYRYLLAQGLEIYQPL